MDGGNFPGTMLHRVFKSGNYSTTVPPSGARSFAPMAMCRQVLVKEDGPAVLGLKYKKR